MDKNDLIIKAISNLRPTAEYSFENDDYSTIQWHVLEGEAPTKSELDAEIKKVEESLKSAELDKETAKTALLDRLGITSDEVKLLLA